MLGLAEKICLLEEKRLSDVFSLLGPHIEDDKLIINVFDQCSNGIEIYFPQFSETFLSKEVKKGFFSVEISDEKFFNQKYLIRSTNDETNKFIADPYAIKPDVDIAYNKWFQSGFAQGLERYFGSHKIVVSDEPVFIFRVWAPNAKYVSVIGTFNNWQETRHPLQKFEPYGIWMICIPSIVEINHEYMYCIIGSNDEKMLKIDPFAQKFAWPENEKAVIIDDKETYEWNDEDFINKRNNINKYEHPMKIYEVHLGSWMRDSNDKVLNYVEYGEKLAEYCKSMHFNYVEIMPLHHHPFDGSWGYQVLGFFAVFSKYGSQSDLKKMIDILHQNNIGVILDVVLCHFAP